MKVLVLGSNGFIGSSIVSSFQKKKKVYKILYPKREELNLLDFSSCEIFFKMNKPDIVINCAVEENNVENTIRIFFNILSLRKFFGRMFNLGSGAEYNPQKYLPLMNEIYSKIDWPKKGYPFSKWLIGDYIDRLNDKNILNLRLFGIYGSNENYYRRFITNNICRSICGLKISMNKDMKLDYLYINDFINLLEKLIFKKKFNFSTYNICSGKPYYLSEIAKLIIVKMNLNNEIVIKDQGFKLEYSGDPSRAIKEFGEFYFFKFEKTIPFLDNHFRKKFKNNNDLKQNFLKLEK